MVIQYTKVTYKSDLKNWLKLRPGESRFEPGKKVKQTLKHENIKTWHTLY